MELLSEYMWFTQITDNQVFIRAYMGMPWCFNLKHGDEPWCGITPNDLSESGSTLVQVMVVPWKHQSISELKMQCYGLEPKE